VVGGSPPPPPTPPAPSPGSALKPLCAGVTVDASGASPASPAIQACIDAAPEGSTLSFAPGIYRITTELRITKPITLRTSGNQGSPACLVSGAPPCATLRADADVVAPRGFLRIEQTHDVSLDHVVLDGNRAARLGSGAASQCRSGSTGAGFNASAGECESCTFIASASIGALCGSGFEWAGDNARILGSTFRDNGDHTQSMMWSDGLTLLRSNAGVVDHCLFVDNSDVDLIIGGATNGSIAHNTVRQADQASFAGLMLDNFNGTAPGDFHGALITGNDIDCGASLCDYAIELGPHPWYPSSNTLGGTVTANAAQGGKVDLNVDGAGTTASPIVVSGNTTGSVSGSATFNCGVRAATSFNVSPDSAVDFGAGPFPTGTLSFQNCP
jgi:hypothetical protein